MLVLRTARPSDAGPLARLGELTFRDTFGAMNTATDMDLHCQTHYGETIQAAEIANPHLTTLLAQAGDKLAGFAQLRWGPAPACIAGVAPGEIQRLYVDREWHGKGIAQELMHACLREMRHRGSDVAWLGVWERNPRAISFYRKFGFVEAGEHVFTLGTDRQRDLLLVRPLLLPDFPQNGI